MQRLLDSSCPLSEVLSASPLTLVMATANSKPALYVTVWPEPSCSLSPFSHHHHHPHHHAYSSLRQFLGVWQALDKHPPILNLINKNLLLPSFPVKKLGPIVQVHPASFLLRTVKTCPSDPNIWLGSLGPGLGIMLSVSASPDRLIWMGVGW